MPRGVWLEAREHMVRDGTGREYLSGWHVFLRQAVALEYLRRFTARPELLRVVPVKVRCVRPKVNAVAPVMLARWIRFEN